MGPSAGHHRTYVIPDDCDAVHPSPPPPSVCDRKATTHLGVQYVNANFAEDGNSTSPTTVVQATCDDGYVMSVTLSAALGSGGALVAWLRWRLGSSTMMGGVFVAQSRRQPLGTLTCVHHRFPEDASIKATCTGGYWQLVNGSANAIESIDPWAPANMFGPITGLLSGSCLPVGHTTSGKCGYVKHHRHAHSCCGSL